MAMEEKLKSFIDYMNDGWDINTDGSTCSIVSKYYCMPSDMSYVALYVDNFDGSLNSVLNGIESGLNDFDNSVGDIVSSQMQNIERNNQKVTVFDLQTICKDLETIEQAYEDLSQMANQFQEQYKVKEECR